MDHPRDFFNDDTGFVNDDSCGLTTVETDSCLDHVGELLATSTDGDCLSQEVEKDDVNLSVTVLPDDCGASLDQLPDEANNNNSSSSQPITLTSQQLITIGNQQFLLFSVDSDKLVLDESTSDAHEKPPDNDEPKTIIHPSKKKRKTTASGDSASKTQTNAKQIGCKYNTRKNTKFSRSVPCAAFVPVASELDVTQAWFTTRDDKELLQTAGHSWKRGQWCKEETDLLASNIASYCQEIGIDDPSMVIFEMTKDERKNFYRTISKGLSRPLFAVYRRVVRMYDQKNHIGRYTPEEVGQLKQLHIKHGSDWATIGSIMGRSASSVKDRCRLIREPCNNGKWYSEEEDRLESAVYYLSGLRPGDTVTSGISWPAVAQLVGTRSEKQCRTKWLNFLNWKVRGGENWTRADDLAIIEKIHNMGVPDEQSINWEVLSEGWASSRSPQWLRSKWWSLKRNVPNPDTLTFPEFVEKMYSYLKSQYLRVQPVVHFAHTILPPLQRKRPMETLDQPLSPEGTMSNSDVFAGSDVHSSTELLASDDYMHSMNRDDQDSVLISSLHDHQIEICTVSEAMMS